MYHVPALSILGMVVSLIISFGTPIALCIIARKKLNAKLRPVLIGVVVFIVFVTILESIMHNVVLTVTGDLLTGNVWLYALYGGLAAGLFEETGRYIAMKYYMKKTLTKQNSIMYGIGHGGIEAILVAGMAAISNISIAFMINSGKIESLLIGLDDTMKNTTMEQLSVLWTLPSYQFYMSGLERISAIILHIALSYLVYRAVKYQKMQFYFLAFGIHFLVDALTVILSNYLSALIYGTLILEIVLLAIMVALAFVVKNLYQKEKDET